MRDQRQPKCFHRNTRHHECVALPNVWQQTERRRCDAPSGDHQQTANCTHTSLHSPQKCSGSWTQSIGIRLAGTLGPIKTLQRCAIQTLFRQFVAHPAGAFAVLALAAYLEVYGDACFSSGLYQATGTRRLLWFLAGTCVLVCYSLFLNSSQLDFGKLLGIYVVLFFLVAQIVAKLKFDQSPTLPIYAGGSLIVLGGLVMTLWRR